MFLGGAVDLLKESFNKLLDAIGFDQYDSKNDEARPVSPGQSKGKIINVCLLAFSNI
jgi:hypothetical protein